MILRQFYATAKTQIKKQQFARLKKRINVTRILLLFLTQKTVQPTTAKVIPYIINSKNINYSFPIPYSLIHNS